MIASKVMDVVARLSDCDEQAADAVSAYTQKNCRMLPDCSKFQNQKVQMFGFVYHTNGKNHGESIEDPVVLFLNEIYMDTHCWIVMGETIFSSTRTWMGENSEQGMYVRSSETRVISVSICG